MSNVMQRGAAATHQSSMLDLMIARAETAAGRGIRFHTSLSESERLDFPRLDLEARHAAVQLRRAGFDPGDRALLAFEAGLEFVRAVYAAMYAGLTIVPAPIAPARSREAMYKRVLRVGEDSASQLVLTTQEIGEELRDQGLAAEIHHLPPSGDWGEADDWDHPGTQPDDIAVLQYTSGSVGVPHGVRVTHGNLLANHRSLATLIGRDHTIVGWLPHYHDMGLTLYLQAIFGGHELIATSPRQFLQRPASWLQLITRYHGTGTAAPDFAYNLCARLVTEKQAAELDLSSLRIAITGAEPVRADTLEQFEKRFAPRGFDPRAFTPAYGMAELTVLASAKRSKAPVSPLELDAEALERGVASVASHGDGKSTRAVSCGPPAPGCTIAIVDPETLMRVGPDHVGEIWVAGESVTDGYWRRPKETAEVFGARLAGESTPYLRTGDLGFMHDGELFVTGRIKDVIIVRGRNIYPTDLEDLVSSEASGGEAISAAFEGPDQSVVVVVEWGADPSTGAEAAAHVRRELEREFSLGRVRVVLTHRGAIPRTTSGKVRRRAASEGLARGLLPVLYDTAAAELGDAP